VVGTHCEHIGGLGALVVLEVPGLGVYPVYRRLLERGLSIKCIKKDAECGGESLQALRIDFPWWADAARVEEALCILREVVTELAGAAPPQPVRMRGPVETGRRSRATSAADTGMIL
jgi:hypothetical protein